MALTDDQKKKNALASGTVYPDVNATMATIAANNMVAKPNPTPDNTVTPSTANQLASSAAAGLGQTATAQGLSDAAAAAGRIADASSLPQAVGAGVNALASGAKAIAVDPTIDAAKGAALAGAGVLSGANQLGTAVKGTLGVVGNQLASGLSGGDPAAATPTAAPTAAEIAAYKAQNGLAVAGASPGSMAGAGTPTNALSSKPVDVTQPTIATQPQDRPVLPSRNGLATPPGGPTGPGMGFDPAAGVTGMSVPSANALAPQPVGPAYSSPNIHVLAPGEQSQLNLLAPPPSNGTFSVIGAPPAAPSYTPLRGDMTPSEWMATVAANRQVKNTIDQGLTAQQISGTNQLGFMNAETNRLSENNRASEIPSTLALRNAQINELGSKNQMQAITTKEAQTVADLQDKASDLSLTPQQRLDAGNQLAAFRNTRNKPDIIPQAELAKLYTEHSAKLTAAGAKPEELPTFSAFASQFRPDLFTPPAKGPAAPEGAISRKVIGGKMRTAVMRGGQWVEQ